MQHSADNVSRSSQSLLNLQQQPTKHDKQESDVSMYRSGSQSSSSVQNTKEESSDESTIISSQTSTLTRNQGCDELQTAVSLRLEELANCLKSPEEEEEEDDESDSESGDSDDSDEEGIIVEFMIEENILEDVLEHEVHFLFILM
jgi:protein KIBRA